MGSSWKSIDCLKNLSTSVTAFPNLLRPNLSACKGIVLTPITEAVFLQSTLKSSKWLDLDSTVDLDLESPFSSTSKGYRMMTKYINYIKYASSKGCTEGMVDEHFMGEMGTWSRLLMDAVRP